MSNDKLRNLPYFEISNEHGSITFHPYDGNTGVDVTEVDLLDVQIKKKEVIVYGKYEKDTTLKPKVGQKLDVPATIKLKNINP